MFTKWCSHCEKLRKADIKKSRQQDMARQKEKFIEEQNAKLEEARKKMLDEELRNQNVISSIFQIGNENSANFAIQKVAEEAAKKDLNGAIPYEDLHFLHYVLLLSAEALNETLY